MSASISPSFTAFEPDASGCVHDPDGLHLVAEKLRLLEEILTSASDPAVSAELAAPVWQLVRSHITQLAAFTRPWARNQADTAANLNAH